LYPTVIIKSGNNLISKGGEMGILGWIILGGIAGWLASYIAGTAASMGVVANIIVGIIGAVVGGWLFSLLFGQEGVTGFNIWSLFVALVGSVVFLGIVRLFMPPGSKQ
jgi:uncharacterized membrane protein YeaQ/YmgE (transglycosylase-associated protein family)